MRTHNEENVCVYCGDFADSIDHIPPKSQRAFIGGDKTLAVNYPFFEVIACRDCNSRLSDCACWTLERRKKYLIDSLKRKHKTLLRAPKWEEEELEELGESLRQYIKTSANKKEKQKLRLSTLGSPNSIHAENLICTKKSKQKIQKEEPELLNTPEETKKVYTEADLPWHNKVLVYNGKNNFYIGTPKPFTSTVIGRIAHQRG